MPSNHRVIRPHTARWRQNPQTRRTYIDAATWLARYVSGDPAVSSWTGVTRLHIRQHMARLTAEFSPAYASVEFRALHGNGRALKSMAYQRP
jgi:hypothetical protein